MNNLSKKTRLIIFSSVIAALLLIVIIFMIWPSDEHRITLSPELREELEGQNIQEEDFKEQIGEFGERIIEARHLKLIDTVQLDKTRVCPNEDFQVRITQPLDVRVPVQYNVNRYRGNPVVLRFVDPGVREFFITASDGSVGVDFKRVTLEVLEKDHPDCAGKPLVVLSARLAALQGETVELEVTRTQNLTGSLRFHWDFGDGTRAENADRFVTHSYAMRDQDDPSSDITITLTVHDEKNTEVVTRATINFPNTYFLAEITGNPVMPVEYDRFPTKRGNNYETNLRIKNIDPVTVDLTRAILKRDTCLAGKEPETGEVPASQLLGNTSIGPKRSQSYRLSLPVDLVGEKTCRLEIIFSGDSIPARQGTRIGPKIDATYGPTTATLYLEINAPPGKEEGGGAGAAERVTDPATIEKLNKARKLLGDRPITPDDIQKLERQGRL